MQQFPELGFKEQRFVTSWFLRSEVQNWCPQAEIKVCTGAVFLLEALQENPFPHLFQLSEVSCISWLVAPSFLFKGISVTFSSHSLVPTLLPPAPPKDSCDQTGPVQILQGPLPISQSLTQLHLRRPFGHGRPYIHSTRHLWGNHQSVYPTGYQNANHDPRLDFCTRKKKCKGNGQIEIQPIDGTSILVMASFMKAENHTVVVQEKINLGNTH